MPTFERQTRFDRDFQRMTSQQRKEFREVVARDFVPNVDTGQFPQSLRVRRMAGTRDKVWEIRWQHGDGRATFHYGEEHQPGVAHVVWRRVGGHEIYSRP